MTKASNTRRSVKHGIPSISGSDVKRQMEEVLTNRWQTLGVLTAQIVIAPELVGRKRIVSGSRTEESAKQNIVTTVLKNMAANGSIARKKNEKGRWEYRKKSQK